MSVLVTLEPAKPNMSSQSWVTVESSMDGSRFSDVMSDEVTIEQQSREKFSDVLTSEKREKVKEKSKTAGLSVPHTQRARPIEGLFQCYG